LHTKSLEAWAVNLRRSWARLVTAGGLADGKSCANANTVSARSLNAFDVAELSSLGDGDVRKNCQTCV
jgi:hypothetical protein